MKKTFETCIDDDSVELLDWIHKHFMNGNYDKFFEVTISLKEFYYNEDDEKVYVDE